MKEMTNSMRELHIDNLFQRRKGNKLCTITIVWYVQYFESDKTNIKLFNLLVSQELFWSFQYIRFPIRCIHNADM